MAERDDRWTVAAIAALAFVFVNVLHEVVGHGLPYVLQGGRDVVFTPARPVFEQLLSREAGIWIDLGGPVPTILLGLLSLAIAVRPGHPTFRLFLTAFGAFAMFWNLGYAPWSLIAREADWHQIARALGDAPALRWAIGVTGTMGYVATAFFVRRLIQRLGGPRARRLALLLWLGGSVAATAGGLLDPRGLLPGLAAALPAGALAALPLLLIWNSGGPASTQMPVVERCRLWQASAFVATALYVFWFGPGVGVSL